MPKRFDDFIDRKIANGILYQHTFAGNDICGKCIYRRPWQNLCAKFNKKIEKVTQGQRWYDRTGKTHNAFHHLPCQECLNYKIQKCDIQYYINAYKKKNPYKVVNIDIDKKLKEQAND